MKQKILLLSCCAPCSCAVIEKMVQDGCDFAVAFYNPNIRPFAEYEKRLLENKKLCDIYSVSFVEFQYDNEHWCNLVKGLEDEAERGNRCDVCFSMRLKKVMEFAKDNGFTAVASVLGVSRYKDLNQVNKNALKMSAEIGVEYIDIEGRKGGMQERRNELTKLLNLYDQDYCGCKPR